MGLLTNLSFRKRNRQSVRAARPASADVAVETLDAEPTQAAVPAAPAADATNRAQAEKLVQRIVQELPAFITVAVVEAATGQILAGQWAGHSGGAVEVALANAEIVRQTSLAIEALQLSQTEQLTDILITLRHQLHLLCVLPQAEWLLYLAVRTQDTNPALVRAVVQMIDN